MLIQLAIPSKAKEMPQGVMEHSRRKKRANQGNWKLL